MNKFKGLLEFLTSQQGQKIWDLDEAYGLTLYLVTLIAGTSLRRTSGRGLLQLFCQGRGLKSRIQGSLRSLRKQLSWTKPPHNTTQKVSAHIFQIGYYFSLLLSSSRLFFPSSLRLLPDTY